MTRRAALTWGLLWFGLASAVFVGIVAGFLILRLVIPDVAIAASRPAAIPTSIAPRDLSGPAAASGWPLPGAPMTLVVPEPTTPVEPAGSGVGVRSSGAPPIVLAARSADLLDGIQPPAVPSATASKPAGVSGSAVVGVASTYGPGFDGYLALPSGPGIRVRICGAGGCVVAVSNDAGPSLAWQRQGRIVDLDVATFERVSGLSWRMGLAVVTITYLDQLP